MMGEVGEVSFSEGVTGGDQKKVLSRDHTGELGRCLGRAVL